MNVDWNIDPDDERLHPYERLWCHRVWFIRFPVAMAYYVAALYRELLHKIQHKHCRCIVTGGKDWLRWPTPYHVLYSLDMRLAITMANAIRDEIDQEILEWLKSIRLKSENL